MINDFFPSLEEILKNKKHNNSQIGPSKMRKCASEKIIQYSQNYSGLSLKNVDFEIKRINNNYINKKLRNDLFHLGRNLNSSFGNVSTNKDSFLPPLSTNNRQRYFDYDNKMKQQKIKRSKVFYGNGLLNKFNSAQVEDTSSKIHSFQIDDYIDLFKTHLNKAKSVKNLNKGIKPYNGKISLKEISKNEKENPWRIKAVERYGKILYEFDFSKQTNKENDKFKLGKYDDSIVRKMIADFEIKQKKEFELEVQIRKSLETLKHSKVTDDKRLYGNLLNIVRNRIKTEKYKYKKI